MARTSLKWRLALVVGSLLWLVSAVGAAQDVTEKLRDRIDVTDKRLYEVERGLSERLIRIETNFETLSFWVRGIGGALVLQLLGRGLDYFFAIRKAVRDRSPGDGGEHSADE